jgi:hypothetical protein
LTAATLYQGNPDRNHKLCNIVPTEGRKDTKGVFRKQLFYGMML